MEKIPQDVVGTVAILKFPKDMWWITRKLKARKFLKEHKQVTTVLEKASKISGELRTQKTRFLAGKRTKETEYKENGLKFVFDVEETYFSPRLSNERKVISDQVIELIKKKKKASVLVMFSGAGPYPIVIAKKIKQNKLDAHITTNELNEKANYYEKQNAKINKVDQFITQIPGDAKKVRLKTKKKFDIILMPRPNLEDTFLKETLELAKKGTILFYHGFGEEEKVINEIKQDTKGKIKNLTIRKAGDIAPRKYRYQAIFEVK